VKTPPAGRALAVLAVGVAVVSTASILIRFAQAEGVPSLSIAATRLGLAALVLLPFAWARARGEIIALAPRDLALTLASGALLAIHFWSWITSLEYTSVASSTVLVTTNPLWVGLASIVLLREKLGTAAIAGLVLSLLGMLMTFAAEPDVAMPARNATLGNGLALVGAVSASGYLLIGRALRARVSLIAYVALAYAGAALVLCVAALFAGAPLLGHTAPAWLFLVLLAVGPQLIGHTTFNWSHRISQFRSIRLRYQFTRLATDVTPLEGNTKDFPEEVVGEVRVLRVDAESSAALVTVSRVDLQIGDRLIARRGY